MGNTLRNIREQLPPRTEYLAISLIGYTCLNKIFHKIGGSILGQDYWGSLEQPRKDRAVLYLLSLVNACLLTGMSVVELYKNYKSCQDIPSTEAHDGTAPSENLLELCNRISRRGIEHPERMKAGYGILHLLCGYLLHDFFKTMVDWAKYKDEWIHHAVSISLLLSVFVFARNPDTRAYPGIGASIGLIEASTIPLNIMWILRETGKNQSVAYRLSSYVFALLFLTVRWVWIPNLCFKVIFKLPAIDNVKIVRPFLTGLCGLQYFWGFKIINAIRTGKMG